MYSKVFKFQVYALVDFYMCMFPFTYLSISQTRISPQELPSCSLAVNNTLPRVNNYSDFYLNRLGFHVLKLHANGIIQYVFFCVFFPSTKFFWALSMLLCIIVVCMFLLLSCIPLCKYCKICLCSLLLVYLWVVFIFFFY